tara:strand:+ start:410 stop:604 length:195 start_codon:yes stop_codon:yes gene_type:complete
LDVYYDCLRTTDPLSTGDSPTSYEVDFISIETLSDTVNMLSILSEDALMDIERQVIDVEGQKYD